MRPPAPPVQHDSKTSPKGQAASKAAASKEAASKEAASKEAVSKEGRVESQTQGFLLLFLGGHDSALTATQTLGGFVIVSASSNPNKLGSCTTALFETI